MDFRDGMVENSVELLEKQWDTPLVDVVQSVCVPTGGSTALGYFVEVPCVLLNAVSMLACVVMLPLSHMGVVSGQLAVIVLVVGFSLVLVLRKMQTLFLNPILKARPGSFIQELKGLPAVDVTLENGHTVERIKLVTEDRGVCYLDRDSHRLLLEGCNYRYVIMGKDVDVVEPVSGYGLSGAKLRYHIGDEPVCLVLSPAGHGPIASLIHTFMPFVQSKSFVDKLKQTLFDGEMPKNAPPPPPPVS